MSNEDPKGYLHGFDETEQARLVHQARFLEHRIHDRLPFQRVRNLLEVGSGVGAQTEIILRHWPDLVLTCVERSGDNIASAEKRLGQIPWADGRWKLVNEDAQKLSFSGDQFDAAFLCWILEHVGNPAQVLSEVRRVLRVGSPVVITEVQNSSFFLDPYSPHTLTYWMAFNDYQLEIGGDPFVGAKLGNLLLAAGYSDIRTDTNTILLDNRAPSERAEFIAFWSDLLLSGAPGLLEAGAVSKETVEGMRGELASIAHNPNAVFWYTFVQARATVS